MSNCCFWWRIEWIITMLGIVGWAVTILTLRRANRALRESVCPHRRSACVVCSDMKAHPEWYAINGNQHPT